MRNKFYRATALGSILTAVLISSFSATTAAHQVPRTEEPMSLTFETIDIRSVFAILGDFTSVEINTDQVTSTLMSVYAKDISPKVLFTSLLDCYGYTTEVSVNGYKIVEGAAAINDPQTCLDLRIDS